MLFSQNDQTITKLVSPGFGFLVYAHCSSTWWLLFALADTGKKMRHALRDGVRETLDEACTAAHRNAT
ncbi:MAG: hypothetical protein IPK19_21895 [Chloroflexi bacterium]|nr:hypothetical protein [Chloroflexota bacterium]